MRSDVFTLGNYKLFKPTTIAIALVGLLSATSFGADFPEFPKPSKEHQWLEKFSGQWETTSKGSMGPDQPPMECAGTIDSRMIGGFWVVNEMKSTAGGMSMQGVQTIGFDPQKKKYIGTWIDSMFNYMWRYEGTVDESGKKLTLEAEGPNLLAGGKMTKFRDAYEFRTPDHIIITSSMLGDDGQWVTFMTGDAKRKKSPPKNAE